MYEEIKSAIIHHEGKINKIYKDHLGNATFGVGHLVLPTDDLKEGVEYDDTTIMESIKRRKENTAWWRPGVPPPGSRAAPRASCRIAAIRL